MIRIAAVDDEMHVLERFERMTLDIKGIELCGLFETGNQLLDYLKKEPLDAVFLDIEMPEVNGIEISEKILDSNENIDVIFVTAFNQYAVEAFEIEAVDYLLKPWTEERLMKTIRRLFKKHKIITYLEKPYIQCVGDFNVFLNGEVLDWKNSKAKEVLAFLVHKEGIPVNWEKIVDAVWPEYDYEKSHKNFHATTYLLRKRLAEAGISQIIKSSRGNYRIVKDQIDCDIYQLEALIQGKQLRRNKDVLLIKNLKQRGYMEQSGYAWIYPRAAELYEMCRTFLED